MAEKPGDFDEVVDLCVIGGGLTGMSCALHAIQAGLKVILLEARGLADGATGRNGGHQWPEPFGKDWRMEIENQDIQSVKAFIQSLSAEWQARISLQENGGLDLFCEQRNKSKAEYFEQELESIKASPIDGEFRLI